MIEVKGSTDTTLRFFLSANEFGRAAQYREAYEVQFWGGIDLNRPAPQEFAILREAGFPRVFVDVLALIENGVLQARPESWRVTDAPPE
jgi:hypothetical protein